MRTFLCGLIGLMLLPAVLMADDFAKFRIPTHTVHSLQASGFGTWDNRYSSGDQNGSYAASSERRSELQGLFSMNGFWLKDSERFRLQTALDLSSRGERNTVNVKQANPSYEDLTDDQKNNFLAESGVASFDAIYYPVELPIGFRSNGYGYAQFQQSWNNDVRISPTDYYRRQDHDRSSWYYNYRLYADLAVGWGRIRDVSSVYDVYVLEQRLQECGALTRPLTDETKQKLINLVYIRADYKSTHDQPERFYWKEVQAILAQDGGLKADGLDAYALYRIADPYLIQVTANGNSSSSRMVWSSYFRERGYFVGFAVQESHIHSIQRQTTNSTVQFNDTTQARTNHTYAHDEASFDQFSVGLRAEGHMPLGMRLQLDGEVAAYLPQHDAPKAMILYSDVQAAYFIADRWLAQLDFEQSRRIERWDSGSNPRRFENRWAVSGGVSLSYYIEDNLSVSLSWSHSQSRYQVEEENSTSGYDYANYTRDNQVFLGFSYSILGKMTAPGIASASKLPFKQN